MENILLKNILPHRYPILLIDKVKNIAIGKSLDAMKKVTASDVRVDEVTDLKKDTYPYSLLIESFGQAAAVLLVKTLGEVKFDEKIVFFGAMKNFQLFSDVYIGDTLELNVQLDTLIDQTVVVSGDMSVAGRTVAVIGAATLGIRAASLL